MGLLRLARAWALAPVCAGLIATSAMAQAWSSSEPPRREASELELKAVYLLKFGDFVQWPAGAFASPDSAFVIAVAGADALASALEVLAQQRRVNGRAVQIKRLRRGEPATGAHILFVAPAELERLSGTQAAAVLTVTESGPPPQVSGIVNFVVRDSRLRFEIDAEAAEAAHLRISSKVLSLAVNVKGSPQR